MSLGGGRSLYDGNPADEAAVAYALRKNVVLVASMGNDGAGANGKNFPAAYPGIIAVGAVDREFKPWKGSNHRDYVSVAAPGKGIVGADDLGTHYAAGIGTSPSSAMVAGAAALIRSRYPGLSPGQVKQAIETGASHRPATGRNDWVGAGILDARSAVLAAYRINKLATGGRPSSAPATTPPMDPPAAVDRSSNLLLIAVLGGGGGLVVVGLVIGLLQRRRSGDEYEPITGEPLEPVGAFAGLPPKAEPRAVPSMYAAPVGVATRQRVGPSDDPRPHEDVPLAYGDDPLSGDLGSLTVPKAETPLADESWRSLLSGRDRAGSAASGARPPEPYPSPDEMPMNIFPAIDPLTDPLTDSLSSTPWELPRVPSSSSLSSPDEPRPARPSGATFGGAGSSSSNDAMDESFGQPARPRSPQDRRFGGHAPRDTDDKESHPSWW
jgi:hypothetical protein